MDIGMDAGAAASYLVAIGASVVALAAVARRPPVGVVVLLAWELLYHHYWPLPANRPQAIAGALGSTVILGATVYFGLLRGLVRTHLSVHLLATHWVALLILIYAVFLLFLGILSGNRFGYAVGDTWKVSWGPAVFLASSLVIRHCEREAIARMLLFVGIVLMAHELVRYVQSFAQGGDIRILTSAQTISMYILCLSVAFAVFRVKGRGVWIAGAGLALSVLILTFGRTFWAGAVAGVFMLLTVGRDGVRARIMRLGLGLGSLTALLAFSIPRQLVTHLLEFGRVRLFQVASPEAWGTRLVEVTSVVEHLADRPLGLIVGSGLGGEIYTLVNVDFVFGWAHTHFLHSNYNELLFRGGLIGILLYVLFFGSWWVRVWRTLARSERDAPIRIGVVAGTLASVTAMGVASIASNAFYYFGTTVYVFMALSLWASRKSIHSPSRPAATEMPCLEAR